MGTTALLAVVSVTRTGSSSSKGQVSVFGMTAARFRAGVFSYAVPTTRKTSNADLSNGPLNSGSQSLRPRPGR